MKKIMILASVVAAACSLQAASYIWGFGNGETSAPDGAYFGEGGYSDASAFLYLGTAGVTDGKLDISGLTYVTSVGAMNPDPDFNWGNFASSLDKMDSSEIVSTDEGQLYTLILVAKDGLTGLAEDNTYEMIVANGKSVIASIPGAGETSYYADFTNPEAYGAGSWASVTIAAAGGGEGGGEDGGTGGIPEPTSGLLLLLGTAGLALRRKRA